MLRLMLIVMTAATVTLVITAAFFCRTTATEELDARAMKLYQAGKYEEAVALWREGVAKYPQSARLHGGLGTMLAVRKEFAEAAEHLETAARLDPKDPRHRRELALCLMQQQRDVEAERELKAAIALQEDFPELHFYLGMIYERRGDREGALEEYVKELNGNPSCTFAWAKLHTWEKTASAAK